MTTYYTTPFKFSCLYIYTNTNDYLKNKKKSRFNILKNYLSNSNPKSKFKNRYQVENAIRKINDEMEDAQKEFSKLFQNNEKDYN